MVLVLGIVKASLGILGIGIGVKKSGIAHVLCTVVVIFLLQYRVRLRMVVLNAIAIARFNSPNSNA